MVFPSNLWVSYGCPLLFPLNSLETCNIHCPPPEKSCTLQRPREQRRSNVPDFFGRGRYCCLTYHWTRLISMMPNFKGIFWIYSETLTLRFKSTYVHMNVDTIWYDISDIRLDIDYRGRILLRILARSIAIPRIRSFTTQSGLWSPAVTPCATATPLKFENSSEKLLGTSGTDANFEVHRTSSTHLATSPNRCVFQKKIYLSV